MMIEESTKLDNDTVSYITFLELDRLKKVIVNERNALILSLLYKTGCTVNELVNIKINDIDLDNNKIIIRNGIKTRIIGISDELSAYIKTFFKKNNIPGYYLFSTRQSLKISTKRVRQLTQLYSKDVTLRKINPYDLRYAHIIHSYLQNIPTKKIKARVGIKELRFNQILKRFKLK